MDLKRKKLYFLGYNLLFNIITIPRKAFFIVIDEFVDASGVPHRVLLFKKISHSFFQTFFITKPPSSQEAM